jgi:hypothetical protein
MPYGYYRPTAIMAAMATLISVPVSASGSVSNAALANRYASSASPLMTSGRRRGSFSLASLAGAAPPLRNCACCKKKLTGERRAVR